MKLCLGVPHRNKWLIPPTKYDKGISCHLAIVSSSNQIVKGNTLSKGWYVGKHNVRGLIIVE